MKELAELASKIGSLQLHYLAIAFGFALAWRIADRKGNDMPRDSRQRVGRISLILILFGLALGLFVVVPPLIVKWSG